MSNIWVSDYETESHIFYEKYGYTKTWLTYTENLETDDNYTSITIEDFYQFIVKQLNKQKVSQFVYFHNLSFDGTFILYYLNSIGTKYETVINDMKRIYEIKVYPSKANRYISFRCSYLIFLCSVESLPYSTKSTIDYLPIRNYTSIDQVTDQEHYYIKEDVRTVKRNLLDLVKRYNVKLTGHFKTMGSISYKELKDTTEKFLRSRNRTWRWYFPELDIDMDTYIRKAYRGGYTYLNPKHKGKVITEEVGSWDRVSSYPSVMVSEFLPAGKPFISKKKPKDDRLLYLVRIRIGKAKIKDGYHPFINPNQTLRYLNDIYPEELNEVVLTLSCIHYDLYLKYYESNHVVLDYCIFPKKVKHIFNDYVLEKYQIKKDTKAIKEKHKKLQETRSLTENEKSKLHDAIFNNFWSKLGLNSPYGKFGTNPHVFSASPIFNEDGLLEWETTDEVKELNKFYLPVAVFITAYAIKALLDQIQPNADRFIYCDTDSIHLIGTETPRSLYGLIANDLNKWEYEGTSYKSKFIKAKQYLKLKDEKGKRVIKRTICSLSRSEHHRINFENFNIGTVIPEGKKISKNVKGGRIIIPRDFTFK